MAGTSGLSMGSPHGLRGTFSDQLCLCSSEGSLHPFFFFFHKPWCCALWPGVSFL